MATFSPSFLRSNEISRLQNVSLYVSLKGPLVRSYDICLQVSRFIQFFSLLLSTFSINCYVRTRVSLPSFYLYVTYSQRSSVRFINLAFSTFLCSLHVSTFARHCSALSKVFSVLVHSYDKSTLLSVSLYVSMFIRYWSCLLNVYRYVSAILIFSFTFLRNLLSHCKSSLSVRRSSVRHTRSYGISFV